MSSFREKYHQECRENGQAMNGVMSTMSSVALTIHLIMNIANANNNNNNNNNNDNNDNNNNNVFVGQQVSQNEFDNEYGTMSMGVGRFFPDFDNYQGEDETQIVNETIPVSIASMLWKSARDHFRKCQMKMPLQELLATFSVRMKK